MNKNIFVACDVSSQKEILDLISKIHNEISGIKIGLQYITQRSPEEIKALTKFNKPIFYDGKFFDIKNTLVESIKSLKDLNVSYATVHLLNGLESLIAANEAASEINVKLMLHLFIAECSARLLRSAKWRWCRTAHDAHKHTACTKFVSCSLTSSSNSLGMQQAPFDGPEA